MSDAEKLSRRSFEPFDAGVEIAGGDAPRADFQRHVDVTYEVDLRPQAAPADSVRPARRAARSARARLRGGDARKAQRDTACADRARHAEGGAAGRDASWSPASTTSQPHAPRRRLRQRGRGGRRDEEPSCRNDPRLSGQAPGRLLVRGGRMMALARYTFLPWLRRGIANAITTPAAARAAPTVRGQPRAERRRRRPARRSTKTFELIGPGDVVGINPSRSCAPSPAHWVTDFEPNYLAFVEFYDEDFPWRYTPAAAGSGAPPDALAHAARAGGGRVRAQPRRRAGR